MSALAVPYGLSYGVGDGLGYLIGTLLHFSISDSLSSVIETTLLVALGLYWIGIFFVARKMQDRSGCRNGRGEASGFCRWP